MSDTVSSNKLAPDKAEELLSVLKERFGKHTSRHKGIKWDNVYNKLISKPDKMWSLNEMEVSGGEPDVIGYDNSTGEFIFFDFSPESPAGRRNLCYDNEALEARKEFKPRDSAVNIASQMGIDLLSEDDFRKLQESGNYDTKTSSWLKTPDSIRKLGGAIFGDRRYDHVFIYHNGAQSYYAARGFRGSLRV